MFSSSTSLSASCAPSRSWRSCSTSATDRLRHGHPLDQIGERLQPALLVAVPGRRFDVHTGRFLDAIVELVERGGVVERTDRHPSQNALQIGPRHAGKHQRHETTRPAPGSPELGDTDGACLVGRRHEGDNERGVAHLRADGGDQVLARWDPCVLAGRLEDVVGAEIAPVAQNRVDEDVDEFGVGAGVTDEDPAHREEALASAGASPETPCASDDEPFRGVGTDELRRRGHAEAAH